MFAALAPASSAYGAEGPGITRVFCRGYPADEVTTERCAAAGVTDITVRRRKEYDLAVKYGMTPYCGIFYVTGPPRQTMTAEEVEAELQTIIGNSGRTLMVCNGPVMIQPGYFEVFKKWHRHLDSTRSAGRKPVATKSRAVKRNETARQP